VDGTTSKNKPKITLKEADDKHFNSLCVNKEMQWFVDSKKD